MKSLFRQVFLLVGSCILLGCTSTVKKDSETSSAVFNLTGQITGYKIAEGPLIGEVSYHDLYTNELLVKVTEISPIGQFQVSLPIRDSQELNLSLGSRYFTFYAIPNGTLHLTMNVNHPDSCQYEGDGADISRELAFYKTFRGNKYINDYSVIESDAKILSPNDFKAKWEDIMTKRLSEIDSLQTARNLTSEIANLLRYNEQLYHGTLFFSFLDSRNRLKNIEPDNPIVQQPTHIDYYTFLQNMPFEKKEAVSLRKYGDIIENIKFSQPMMDAANSVKDTIITLKYTFLTYLLDKNVPLTDEERKIAESHLDFVGVHKVDPVFLKEFNEKLNNSVYRPFEEKYKAWTDSFQIKVQKDVEAGNQPLNVLISSTGNEPTTLQKRWEACHKVFMEMYPLTPSLTSDILTLQYFIDQLKEIESVADADTLFAERINTVSDHTIKSIMKEKYQNRFSVSRKIPETKGGDIVRRMIAPHKGKFVLLDFWGTTCGPCRADIDRFSELRKSYTESPDFTYLFVSSPQNSPEEDYKKFVSSKLEGEESIFLPMNEFAYLQELFNMNGIPRYVLINREGEIMDDNFDLYGLESFLKNEGIRK